MRIAQGQDPERSRTPRVVRPVVSESRAHAECDLGHDQREQEEESGTTERAGDGVEHHEWMDSTDSSRQTLCYQRQSACAQRLL